VLKGSKHTPETLAKMSAARRGKRPMLGKRLSEEAKAKISAAHKGRRKPRKKPVSPEHRAKIAASLTGRTLSAEHRAAIAAALTGKTIPAEGRAKMSASQRRRRALEASGADRLDIGPEQVGKAVGATERPTLSRRQCCGDSATGSIPSWSSWRSGV
jgi:hypothetical protein